MPSRYFFGKSVKTNQVTASSARSFRDLVQKHLEPAVKLSVTQTEYLALKTKAEKLEAKDSPYLLACSYSADRTSRSIENAEDCCNLIFLDLDEEASGACPAAPFVKNPEILLKSLHPFSFAAYTTASSTKAKPRMRIVVDAEAIPLARYPQAVRSVAKMLGLLNITKESLIPNQPMILPSLFADQDPDMEHPMIKSHWKGEPFTVDHLAEEDETGVTVPSKRKAATYEDDDDGLEYLRAPLEGFTLEMAKDALSALSPDMGYLEWLDVVAALRHQFSHSEPEEAYEVFDTWSSKGDKYVSPEDTRAKWDSIRPTPKGRVPVTIRTLIKRASDAGWKVGEAKAACLEAVLDWIHEEATTLYDFTHVALQKIAGLPMITSVEEDLALAAIRTNLREKKEESGITKVSLQKDLKKIREFKEKIKDGAAIKENPAWTKGWCYVTCQEVFFRSSTHQKMTPQALDDAFGRYLLPTEEQLEALGREVNQAELNKPLYSPKSYLLHHQQCLVVDDYAYDPTSPNDVYTETPEGVRLVNTYRRSYPKPFKPGAKRAGDIWLGHLNHLVAEEDYRKTLCDYFAYMVQFPGKKIRWAPLIQGAEGCGKTLMAKALGSVLGDSNVTFVNNESIRGQWNDWAFGSQAVVIGEVRIAGHNRHDVMNRLKDLVTDDRIAINQRNRDTRTVDNISNYIMFTNHHDALAVMSGSRRYFVLKSALQTEEQVLSLGEGYFAKVFDMLSNNAAGLRAFFEDWSIDDNFPADGRAPKTKYLEELIEDSADDLTSAIRRLIKEGDCPLIQDDLIAASTLSAALELDEGLARGNGPRIAKVLRDENFVRLPGRGAMIGETRQALWVRSGRLLGVDPVEVARQRLENQNDRNFC